MNHIPRPEYPRPQFRGFGCIYLNGEWIFAFNDKGAGFMQGWQRTTAETLRSGDFLFNRRINVPFCYQAELSGLGHRTFHNVIWSAILQYTYTTNYAVIMVGDVIASIPVIIVFPNAQRYIIEGASRSVLKG